MKEIVKTHKDKTFEIYMDENTWGTLEDNTYSLKVLSTPKKKFFLKILEIITFKLYKAPISYKCKIANKGNSFNKEKEIE